MALGGLLGGAVGNLVDRLTRDPGFGRGHVVDWIELPHWPVFNLADASICCAAVLMVAAVASWAATWTGRGTATVAEQRALPVPDGLEGERVDAGLARLFGLSRTRAADLAAGRRGAGWTGTSRQVRASARRQLARGRPARRRRRATAGPRRPTWSSSAACAWCTTTPTSWWSTSRSASPRTRAPAGPDRPWSAGWRRPATGSRPAAPPSGRGSCTAWTSAPAG